MSLHARPVAVDLKGKVDELLSRMLAIQGAFVVVRHGWQEFSADVDFDLEFVT